MTKQSDIYYLHSSKVEYQNQTFLIHNLNWQLSVITDLFLYLLLCTKEHFGGNLNIFKDNIQHTRFLYTLFFITCNKKSKIIFPYDLAIKIG